MTGVPVPAVAPPPPVERLLWRLIKGRRIAEAHVRDVPHGAELRFTVNGALVWSKVFRGAQAERELQTMADAKLTEFERLEWSAAE